MSQVSTNAPHPRLPLTFPYGINENPMPDIGEASTGYNFDIGVNQESLIPRKPFDLKGTAPNASPVNGIMQLVKRDNTQTTLIAAGTSVYKWDGANSWTSVATITNSGLLRDTYWSLGDYSVITDVGLNNVVKMWDGTTFSNLPTGLGATPLYAKYGLVHNGRVWLFNVTTNTATPHMMVASAFENPQSYSVSSRAVTGTFATGLEAFYMLTPDLKPINGVTLFQNSLIISTLGGRLFQLTGSDAKSYAWTDFFDGSPAVGAESLASIGNDVVFMRQGGHINLLSATQTFGNARTDELTRWIPNTVKNLSGANQIIYDVTNQKVLFFVQGKVLVLFKDLIARDRYQLRDGKSPWGVYTTSDPSNFNTSAAKYMLIPGTTNYSVYWGDSTGRVFDLNGTGSAGDAGASSIAVLRKSRHIGSDVVAPTKKQKNVFPWLEENITGKLHYRRLSAINATVSLDWDDEYSIGSSVLSLKGPPAGDTAPYFGANIYFGGGNYYNAGFAFANRVSSMNFSPGGKGPGFYVSLSTSTNQTFQIDKIEFD